MKNVSTHTQTHTGFPLNTVKELLAVVHRLRKQHCDNHQMFFSPGKYQAGRYNNLSFFLPLCFIHANIFRLSLAHTHTHLLLSPSISSSELRSIVNMSSSSENSSPLSSLLSPAPPPPPSGRAFFFLFLLFLVNPPSLCCSPRFWTGSGPHEMESIWWERVS